MPVTRTQDIKLSFEQYDGLPGPDCRRFRRNLIQCGGKTDARGYSIADCLLRQDEGAVLPGTGIPGVAAVPMPGVPAIPAGGAGVDARRKARDARVKESATWVIMHLVHEGDR